MEFAAAVLIAKGHGAGVLRLHHSIFAYHKWNEQMKQAIKWEKEHRSQSHSFTSIWRVSVFLRKKWWCLLRKRAAPTLYEQANEHVISEHLTYVIHSIHYHSYESFSASKQDRIKINQRFYDNFGLDPPTPLFPSSLPTFGKNSNQSVT